MPSFANKQINTLVDAEVAHVYELHPGVNDRRLGRMYVLKQFEKAVQEEYETLRNEFRHHQADEKCVVEDDGCFQLEATPRKGSSKLDANTLINNLTNEFMKPGITRKEAYAQATKLVGGAYIYGKDSVTLSVIKVT